MIQGIESAIADMLADASADQVHALALQAGVEDFVIEDAIAAARAVVRLFPSKPPAEAVRYFKLPDNIRHAGALRAA